MMRMQMMGRIRKTSNRAAHTTTRHKGIGHVLHVEQTESGDGAEGGDRLERVACEEVMLARNDMQCAHGR